MFKPLDVDTCQLHILYTISDTYPAPKFGTLLYLKNSLFESLHL